MTNNKNGLDKRKPFQWAETMHFLSNFNFWNFKEPVRSYCISTSYLWDFMVSKINNRLRSQAGNAQNNYIPQRNAKEKLTRSTTLSFR